MVAVQPGRFGKGDKELTAVRVRPGVRHRQKAGAVELQAGNNLILELVAGPAGAASGWIARLGHEILQHAMKVRVVVEAIAGQKDEIIHRCRGLVGEEPHAHIAFLGLENGVVLARRVNRHRRRSAVHPVAGRRFDGGRRAAVCLYDFFRRLGSRVTGGDDEGAEQQEGDDTSAQTAFSHVGPGGDSDLCGRHR